MAGICWGRGAGSAAAEEGAQGSHPWHIPESWQDGALQTPEVSTCCLWMGKSSLLGFPEN